MLRDPNQYTGAIPGIAKAYQNDPRTLLAQSLVAAGTAGAPVAQGGWAIPDGLAKAAQAMLGAYLTKKQDKKYAPYEQDVVARTKAMAGLASTPQPQMAPPAALAPPQAPPDPMGAAASALGGPQGASPLPMAPTPMMAPQGAPAPAPGGAGGPMAGMVAASASIPGLTGAGTPLDDPLTAPMKPLTAPGGAMDYYRRGIRPIEGGTDPVTGAFRTSPKGAIGPGQIMPGTGPEAARLAGLPWDERRFRTDTQYNDALGAAYYSKQLNDFGDPLKAAAAYNGGPGALRRTLRRARQAGDEANWVNYYPAANKETPAYVAKFASKIGGDVGAPATAAMGAVPAPEMEQVPGAAEMPTQAPVAPPLPEEVQTNRFAMAQEMLSSDNPFMVELAQAYLDKGLEEQNSARTLRSQQEFNRGQAGYQAGLDDFNAARSTARNAAVQDRQQVQSRNFTRETNYTQNRFDAGQKQIDRNFTAGQSALQRSFQAEQDKIQRGWQSGEADKERDNRLEVAGIRKDASGQRQQQRNAYFSTPTGLKMQEKAGQEIEANNVAISKFQRFLDLNEKQDTGGILNTPGATAIYGSFNSSISEMEALGNDTTLAKIGGSLGTAISDGDRKFITGSNVSASKSRDTNKNLGNATIAALRRKSDYIVSFANAQADGTSQYFLKDWNTFINATPLVKYGKDGKGSAKSDTPITFEQWKASRPKFDATGKRVN